jgi:hypothetical protein
MNFMKFELKKYWIYLIVIILIILYYGRTTTFEGMTEPEKDMQLAMALNFYDLFTNALQFAKDANDTLTENYIQFEILPQVIKQVGPILDNADPKDIIRIRASNKVNIEKQKQKRKDLGIPEDPPNSMYLGLKEQAIRTNYKYIPTSPVTTSTFFDDNLTLYTSFTTYNSAYYNYVSCVEDTYNNTTATYDSSYNILNGKPTFNSKQCNKQADYLNNAYTVLNSAISKVKSTGQAINEDITSIDNIKTKENNNNTLRSELDLKLQDLYSVQDSLSDMSQKNIDSTTYAFILWSILASSILIYIFILSS